MLISIFLHLREQRLYLGEFIVGKPQMKWLFGAGSDKRLGFEKIEIGFKRMKIRGMLFYKLIMYENVENVNLAFLKPLSNANQNIWLPVLFSLTGNLCGC